jgi:hypothetical protein
LADLFLVFAELKLVFAAETVVSTSPQTASTVAFHFPGNGFTSTARNCTEVGAAAGIGTRAETSTAPLAPSIRYPAPTTCRPAGQSLVVLDVGLHGSERVITLRQ